MLLNACLVAAQSSLLVASLSCCHVSLMKSVSVFISK